jgi:hypothetical protein
MAEVTVPEIPISYVKANQIGIVAFILLATIFMMPFFLILLWVIQISGAIFGTNLFIQLAKTFVKVEGKETQARELQRFNVTLGILFLTISLICFANHWVFAGYLFAWMLGIVALIALSGYCLGCTIYYQFKKFKALRKTNRNK